MRKFLRVPRSTKTNYAINVKWNISREALDMIKDLSKETGVKGKNPGQSMWMLNNFAKTKEWAKFRKRIYKAKTLFTSSALKNTWNKLNWKKIKFKFKWWENGSAMSMHPKSWIKVLKREWLIE